MPIVTIAHRCENSGTNRLNPAAGKITAMQSGSSAFLRKIMFGNSHFRSQFANAADRTGGELGPLGLDLY